MQKIKIYELSLNDNQMSSFVKYDDYMNLYKKYIRSRNLAKKNNLKLNLFKNTLQNFKKQ